MKNPLATPRTVHQGTIRGRLYGGFGVLLAALVLAHPVAAGGRFCAPPVDYVKLAAAPGDKDRQAAIDSLRAMGPSGLQVVLAQLTAEKKEKIAASAGAQDALANIEAAIDGIAQQRGASLAGLYWYTDMAAAQAAATAAGKPILSLRLLGKLDEEYSCANSRFFRKVLYSNAKVAADLRNGFILHWQSVRPVPVVTVDFGDGRELKRTLTGNSIHYALDAEGRPLDALPGLHNPDAFRAWLGRVDALAASLRAKDADRDALLTGYHRGRLDAIATAWEQDLQALEIDVRKAAKQLAAVQPTGERRRLEKLMTEPPRRKADTPAERAQRYRARATRLELVSGDAVWAQLAARHRTSAELHPAVMQAMQPKFPNAKLAMPLAVTKAFVETPLMRAVRNLESSMAMDTVRNEYQMHRHIHEYMLTLGGQPSVLTIPPRPRRGPSMLPVKATEVGRLNDWVYAELFLTPSEDPWLGLAPSDAFAALTDGGKR